MAMPFKKPSEKPAFVFVYGTLKKGGRLHQALEEANGVFIGEHTTEPIFTMYDLGNYPAVIIGGMTKITGEVYQVDDLKDLDIVEGYPKLYNRTSIRTPYGSVWMYVMAPSVLQHFNYRKQIRDGIYK